MLALLFEYLQHKIQFVPSKVCNTGMYLHIILHSGLAICPTAPPPNAVAMFLPTAGDLAIAAQMRMFANAVRPCQSCMMSFCHGTLVHMEHCVCDAP